MASSWSRLMSMALLVTAAHGASVKREALFASTPWDASFLGEARASGASSAEVATLCQTDRYSTSIFRLCYACVPIEAEQERNSGDFMQTMKMECDVVLDGSEPTIVGESTLEYTQTISRSTSSDGSIVDDVKEEAKQISKFYENSLVHQTAGITSREVVTKEHTIYKVEIVEMNGVKSTVWTSESDDEWKDTMDGDERFGSFAFQETFKRECSGRERAMDVEEHDDKPGFSLYSRIITNSEGVSCKSLIDSQLAETYQQAILKTILLDSENNVTEVRVCNRKGAGDSKAKILLERSGVSEFMASIRATTTGSNAMTTIIISSAFYRFYQMTRNYELLAECTSTYEDSCQGEVFVGESEAPLWTSTSTDTGQSHCVSEETGFFITTDSSIYIQTYVIEDQSHAICGTACRPSEMGITIDTADRQDSYVDVEGAVFTSKVTESRKSEAHYIYVGLEEVTLVLTSTLECSFDTVDVFLAVQVGLQEISYVRAAWADASTTVQSVATSLSGYHVRAIEAASSCEAEYTLEDTWDDNNPKTDFGKCEEQCFAVGVEEGSFEAAEWQMWAAVWTPSSQEFFETIASNFTRNVEFNGVYSCRSVILESGEWKPCSTSSYFFNHDEQGLIA